MTGVPLRQPPLRTLATAVTVAAAVLAGGAGCTSNKAPSLDPPASAGPTGPTDPWGRLAARVAAAQDKRYIATYNLVVKGHPTRTVTVTVASDGSWLVAVPGGALGGTADITIADTPAGLFECQDAGCVRVGDSNARLPTRADPRVEHLFTDWLAVLIDRQAAISVDDAPLVNGARGACFSIEPDSAALATPVDAGVYCYDTDGTLTTAILGVGTFALVGAPAPAPGSVTLPGPVVAGAPLPTAAPPTSPSPTAVRVP
jgi:hypothetical protein